MLLIHGGAWDSENQFVSKGERPPRAEIAEQLQAAGFCVVTMNYVLAVKTPEQRAFPIQVQDVEAVVKWIEEHAGEYNGDGTRVLILGASSGGNIGLLAAQKINKAAGARKIKAVVALSPPDDLVLMVEEEAIVSSVEKALGATAAEIKTAASAAQKRAEEYSPVHGIEGSTHPATILFGSLNENIVPVQQQKNMQTALAGAGVEVKRYEPNGGHAFAYWESTANGGTTGTEPTTSARAIDWLRSHS